MWWTKLYNPFDRFSKVILLTQNIFLSDWNETCAFRKIHNIKRDFHQTNELIVEIIFYPILKWTWKNLCINSSNVAWYRSGRRGNVKDLITSFFNAGIDVCKYFVYLMKKSSNFLQEFFVLRGFYDVIVPCILLFHYSNEYTVNPFMHVVNWPYFKNLAVFTPQHF